MKPCRQNAFRDVHGFTLIEMMVAISATSVLFTIAIRLIHQTMTMSETARGCAMAQQSAERLARQFRLDVQEGVAASHASREKTSDGQAPMVASQELHIQLLGDAEIVWRAAASHATRVEQTSAGVERRERYRFPEDCRTTFALLDAGRRAALIISRGHDRLGATPREQVRVEAVVGRLQRLAGREEDSP